LASQGSARSAACRRSAANASRTDGGPAVRAIASHDGSMSLGSRAAQTQVAVAVCRARVPISSGVRPASNGFAPESTSYSDAGFTDIKFRVSSQRLGKAVCHDVPGVCRERPRGIEESHTPKSITRLARRINQDVRSLRSRSTPLVPVVHPAHPANTSGCRSTMADGTYWSGCGPVHTGHRLLARHRVRGVVHARPARGNRRVVRRAAWSNRSQSPAPRAEATGSTHATVGERRVGRFKDCPPPAKARPLEGNVYHAPARPPGVQASLPRLLPSPSVSGDPSDVRHLQTAGHRPHGGFHERIAFVPAEPKACHDRLRDPIVSSTELSMGCVMCTITYPSASDAAATPAPPSIRG
jgi:hypothetical protein